MYLEPKSLPQMLNVWYIYTYIYHKNCQMQVNIPYMEHLGSYFWKTSIIKTNVSGQLTPPSKQKVSHLQWCHPSPTKPNMLDEIESETRKIMGLKDTEISW